MINRIADFAPDGVESGVGLVIQDDMGRYLFFLAGSRHRCPPGELFYAGIGGHREEGESWLDCAHREAREEIDAEITILHSESTWYIPQGGSIEHLKLDENPRPFALYEMIHPPDSPREGELYRIVIYRARLMGSPRNLPPDEVAGIVALPPEQVRGSLRGKPSLGNLMDHGAVLIVGGDNIAETTRLYPIGTARAIADILNTLHSA